MFKAQVLRRSFSVFNRVPTARIVQSAARDGHESITIHRVRIQRPFLSTQRLVGVVAITAATYGLGQYLGLAVEIEEEEVEGERKPGRWKKQVRKEDGSLEEVDDKEANADDDEGEDEEDEEEEEYDDALLFFPTGFSRLKPKTFYKGSDPEWQEFKKVANDKKRAQRIQQELVDTIRTGFSASPQHVAVIGPVDHKKGRAWIEIKFPDGPPPGYEQPGYELTQDLEWRKATRDVEPLHHHRLKKVLHPTAVAGALYDDTKRKATQSWNDFAIYMGWAEKTEPHAFQEMMQQLSNTSPSTSSDKPPATAASAASSGPSMPATSASPPAAGSAKDLGFALPDPKSLTLDLGQFRRDFQKANKPIHPLPRGSFGVRALIEVYGTKAHLTLNVLGVYDPKIGRYVALQISVWNQTLHQQSPRGGP